jgi:hypothetical protein
MARLARATSTGWVDMHNPPGFPVPGGGPPGILWGINVNDTEYRGSATNRLQDYGRVPCTRLYYTGMLPNAISVLETGRAPEKRAQVSFKALPVDILAGTYDATILSYAQSASAAGFTIFLTYWHEPNGELNTGVFTPTDYKNAHYHVSALLNASPYANSVIPMPCYSARKTLRGAPLDPTWLPLYSLMGNTRAVLAWDSYGFPGRATIGGVNQTDLTEPYMPMGQIFSLMMQDTVTAGYNFDGGWGVTEFNTPRRSFDYPNFAGKVQFHTDAINYLLTQGPIKANGQPATPHHIFVWSGDDANWNDLTTGKTGWDPNNIPCALNNTTEAEFVTWRTRFATSI